MCITAAQAAPYAYVTNELSDSVTVVNAFSYKKIATIPVGSGPIGVSVSPDGERIYTANSAAPDGTVSILDASINQLIGEVTAGVGTSGVAVSPNGQRVYATNYNIATVSIIDTTLTPPAVVETVNVDTAPYGVTVDPTGRYVYVGNSIASTLSVIDTSQTPAFVTQVNSSEIVNPYGIALSADGSKLYVANYKDGFDRGSLLIIQTSAIDKTQASVTLPSSAIQTITLGKNPYGIAVDSQKAYIANYGDQTLSVVDITASSPTATTVSSTAFLVPLGVSLTPDGSTLAVANYYAGSENHVSFIRTSLLTTSSPTLTLSASDVHSVSVGSTPVAFGNFIGPDQPSTLIISPTSLSFGEQEIDTQSTPQEITLYYQEDNSPLIGTIRVTGDFVITSNSCASSSGDLPSGCSVSIAFLPTVPGERQGSLLIEDEDNNREYVVPLSGFGRAFLGGGGMSCSFHPDSMANSSGFFGGLLLLIVSIRSFHIFFHPLRLFHPSSRK